MSVLKGKKENAINGKQKDSARREPLGVSAMRTNVENQRAHPLLLQNCRRKAMRKII